MVDYNNFAKTFSNSRKNMKWEEIEYFLSFLEGKKDLKFLDIGCGNGRLLGEIKKKELDYNDYLGVDLSSGLIEEAEKMHKEADFKELDMLKVNTLHNKYNVIFFIASYHHLKNIDDRINVLNLVFELLDEGGMIFFTNWSLNSDLNKKRYNEAIIPGSENEFGSLDYNIRLGGNDRYYHSFDLKELEYLFEKTGFQLIENREFDNKRNFVSIIKKVGE